MNIKPEVRAAFDKAVGKVELIGMEDFDGGKLREFTFTAAGRTFVIGVRVEGESDEELAAFAGYRAKSRAEVAEREKAQ